MSVFESQRQYTTTLEEKDGTNLFSVVVYSLFGSIVVVGLRDERTHENKPTKHVTHVTMIRGDLQAFSVS